MKHRLVVIAGPTASGKSALAHAIARRVGGDILVADSRQVYRGMDIGTAKPSTSERGDIRYHGIDVVDPGEPFHAAEFVALAHRVINDAASRKVPIIVEGGTGLYLRALVRGLMDAPPRDEALRERLREEAARLGWPALHARLADVDPDYAARIQPTDPIRITRALEVFELTGQAFSAFEKAHAFQEAPFDTLGLLVELPREVLNARIARRVDAMWNHGIVAETEQLMARLPVDAPLLGTINYAQARAFLLGELDANAAREGMTLRTVQYAKRQRTWFKKEPWLRPVNPSDAAILDEAARFLAG